MALFLILCCRAEEGVEPGTNTELHCCLGKLSFPFFSLFFDIGKNSFQHAIRGFRAFRTFLMCISDIFGIIFIVNDSFNMHWKLNKSTKKTANLVREGIPIFSVSVSDKHRIPFLPIFCSDVSQYASTLLHQLPLFHRVIFGDASVLRCFVAIRATCSVLLHHFWWHFCSFLFCCNLWWHLSCPMCHKHTPHPSADLSFSLTPPHPFSPGFILLSWGNSFRHFISRVPLNLQK